MKEHKKRHLVTIKVTPETAYHLNQMAAASGLDWAGQVVDKIVRTIRAEIQTEKNSK